MTQQPTPCWPAGCSAAISLTFDDGAPSQLQRAVPMMNDADLQGSFYINPRGDDLLAKLAPWRAVADAGHEIGNHTMAHLCSRAFRREPDARGLENATLDDLEKDIAEAKRRLQLIAPNQVEMSFAYPCYMEHVGSGPTRQSYVPVVARHHIAGRGKGEFPFANHPATVDLHYETDPSADPGVVSEDRAVAGLPPTSLAYNTKAKNPRGSGGLVPQFPPQEPVLPYTKPTPDFPFHAEPGQPPLSRFSMTPTRLKS